MANSNMPMGLTPRRYRNGSPWMGAMRTYFVPASDATALYVGDPVIIAGDGDTLGNPSCTRASVGGRITGVVVGFRPSPTILANRYRAASTAEYVLVADDPDLLYEIQETGTALTAADIGLNANLTFATAGSTFTGLSGAQLDTSTKATTAGLQLRIVQLQHRADNDFGTNAKWLVANNASTETGAAGSTGV